MPLRVVVNASPLLAPRTGIGNYIVELGAALAQRNDVDLHAFYGYRWSHAPPSSPRVGRSTESVRSLRNFVKPWIPFRRELRRFQQRITFNRGCRHNAIDVYHEPNYVPIDYDFPVVITVHDLSWLRFPQTHPPDRVRWLEQGLPRALERAAAILVDSNFVRDELIAEFNVPSARLHVAQLGVSTAFTPRSIEHTRGALKAFSLEHRAYILSVGTIEPRKNLSHVLQAFARLPTLLQQRFPLVIAGARGWQAGDLERELRVLSAQGRVRFLGHVNDEQLVNLYAGAALFVFPSLYEGFGLPPLEAMASGTPVLVSDAGSLREVVGDAAPKLDPRDPEGTASRMQALLEDPSAREAYVRRGIVQASRFTWAACAERTAAVLHAAVNEH